MQRLDVPDGLANMRKDKAAKADNDDYSRYRNEERQSSSVFGTKIIERSDNEDRTASSKLRVRQAKILKGGKCANRSGDNVIGDQQEGTDYGDDF